MPVAAGSSTKVEGIRKMGEEGCVRVVGTRGMVLGNRLAGGTPDVSKCRSVSVSAQAQGQIGGEALCIAAVVYRASGAQNWEGAREKAHRAGMMSSGGWNRASSA
jgi:hypothetical protein